MVYTAKAPRSEPLPIGVSEIPGEPAIVIYGVPEISRNESSQVVSSNAVSQENTSADAGFLGNTNFTEWIEGREVQKYFRDKLYSGTVTEFDNENGWYRVVYEDGDFEDLDWPELEKVLVPLDITVPLKSLALRVRKKSAKKTEKNEAQTKTGKAKSLANKGMANQGT